VLLYVLLFCIVLCIVCVKCVLPPGDNPIAVNKYIIYHIGVRSSIRNLRTCHAVLTATHLSQGRLIVFVWTIGTWIRCAWRNKYPYLARMKQKRAHNKGSHQNKKPFTVQFQSKTHCYVFYESQRSST